eukprot:CAMPEP_0185746420 /NCGR_PEP_ID=MMETSP1174-20130828/4971_1 /TAXON_ID=35687 /ORGANISM="Dictyocha speculum, Strain CCMP1381" /LENGTH=82 /DNA_ID=CAMNT_0028421093 /DNA_START=69 /DNA_END=317 /DNA_ORIENTATION=-
MTLHAKECANNTAAVSDRFTHSKPNRLFYLHFSRHLETNGDPSQVGGDASVRVLLGVSSQCATLRLVVRASRRIARHSNKKR